MAKTARDVLGNNARSGMQRWFADSHGTGHLSQSWLKDENESYKVVPLLPQRITILFFLIFFL